MKLIELFLEDLDNEDEGVSAIALVDKPAIELPFHFFSKHEGLEFAEGVPHYTEDGVLWTGPTHKTADGRLMTGEVHTADSEYLYHLDEFDFPEDTCWPGYEPIGTKSKGGRKVPNCVPVKAAKFAESYTDYPKAASANAQRALDWAEENGWGSCGTPVGKIRANQLANREAISRDTVARMASFERHRRNSDTPYDEGCGKLMWDCWGGDEGIAWAQAKLGQIDKLSFDVNVSGLAPYVDQVTKDQPLKEKILEETLLAQPIASFDYDDTLSTQRGLDLARRYQSGGYKLIIITSRNMSGSGVVYDVAAKLGIPKSDVHFTNGQPKWITVQKLGVRVHIDHNAADVRKVIENTNSDASLFSEDPTLDSEVHELMIEVLATVLGEAHRAEFDFIDQHRFKVDAKNIDRVIDAGELNSGDLTLNDGGTLKLRLRYRGPVDGKNRKLCAKLMTLNRLYTVNDVQQLNRIIPSSDVPRPAGGVIDLYQWKGGANCRHSWEQVVFIETTGGAIRLQSTQIVSGTNPPAASGKRGFSQFAINEDQRIVIGPAMIPDMNIDRVDENGDTYQVFFSKETVKAVAEKFARELRLPDTNIDHNTLDKADSYVYETWIVEDTEKDKSALYGFKLPVGSWMVAMKVVSDKTWAFVKQGYLTGFSIEGYFAEKEFTEA